MATGAETSTGELKLSIPLIPPAQSLSATGWAACGGTAIIARPIRCSRTTVVILWDGKRGIVLRQEFQLVDVGVETGAQIDPLLGEVGVLQERLPQPSEPDNTGSSSGR